MKIFDISQEVFSCEVYPTDPKPTKVKKPSIDRGDIYNLTTFSMCAHNGTHIDAPYHFFNDGKTVDQISLNKFVGSCMLYSIEGEVTGQIARKILTKANGVKKILLKGNCLINKESAEVFAQNKIDLLGVESQSVGDANAPMEVHKILLKEDIVLLEGIRLKHIDDGEYFLCAQPLNLGGADGSPTRAILIQE